MHLLFGGTVGLIKQMQQVWPLSYGARADTEYWGEKVGAAGSDLRWVTGGRAAAQRGGPCPRHRIVERCSATCIALIELPTAWRGVFQGTSFSEKVVYWKTYGTAGKGVYYVFSKIFLHRSCSGGRNLSAQAKVV